MPFSKNVLLFGFLLFFCSFSVNAQDNYTINGVVKDSLSGETLIGVTLKFTAASQSGTSTNAYGFYSYKLSPGEYNLSVSYIGYRSINRKISINSDLRLDLNMVPDNILEEIVISSEKRNDNIVNAQMGVAKINLSEIRNVPVLFGERDVLKTLQLLPGIKSAGEGNSGFYVRGGSTDQNLILLDEAPVYNASHLLGFFSTFNSDAIKDVSVFKGGMPAQYGGRLSSVLDIRMNDGNKKEFTAEGGIGLISSRLKVEGPLIKDKSSFMISGRRTYADAFLALSKDSSINKNTLYFYDLNAKVNYQIDDKNTLYLSGYFGRDELGLSETFGFDWGNATSTLRWNHLFSNRLFSNTSLIYSNYNYVIENFLEENNFKVNSSIRDMNLKQDFQLALNNSHNVRFGLDLIHHTIAPGNITASATSSVNEVTIEKRKGNEIAAYISDEWEVNDKFNLVYGLRASSFLLFGPGVFPTLDKDGITTSSKTYTSGQLVKSYLNLEPRISASYQLNEFSSLKSSFTRNTQNLHLMSNSTASSPTDLYIMSSNNVKPEIADQIALGYFRNFNNDNYEFSTELYFKQMQNQIDYRSGTDLRGNTNVESDLLFGDGRAFGIELFLKKRFGKLNGWVGYTLSKTERKFNDIDLGKWFNAKQDRTHDLSLVGIYKATERWTFSSTFVFNTGNAVTFPAGKYQLNNKTVYYYPERNSDRMPNYHRLDLSATLEGKPGKKLQSSWSFGIYNLYNRKNAYSIDFRDDPDNPTRTQAVRTTLFGIIPSITWNFKF
ncbi:MAG: collagen-binding protein [Sphingobacteriales bacterium 17-39-43]|uniref:TonB-dependent receptor n=1 Tax=Daejeonella sp. TaxID=2805397 RepID=UPI000BDB0B45|nr:TonB-dependent receptor [Daejeonella sp.]OYZ30725.1 MAG: collagen-binding protein [Sphingobacteriales bacterium 16-39-50]OZA23467.1 MAG: collagen-binding protein [Sphingobacteriales bacterium 17-39-43]HQT23838.1 TonB-dependent receptor [Daejeonella sp.]HQT58549.1 TonB-dependent receptor [Daejeonella sp.]